MIKRIWADMPFTLRSGLIAIVAIVLLALAYFIWSLFSYSAQVSKLSKERVELKEENRSITDAYNQKTGEAKAWELQAREEKAKADALIAAIEQGNKNVRVLDDKIREAEENYEEAKRNQGECADVNACLELLCKELRESGFRCP